VHAIVQKRHLIDDIKSDISDAEGGNEFLGTSLPFDFQRMIAIGFIDREESGGWTRSSVTKLDFQVK